MSLFRRSRRIASTTIGVAVAVAAVWTAAGCHGPRRLGASASDCRTDLFGKCRFVNKCGICVRCRSGLSGVPGWNGVVSIQVADQGRISEYPCSVHGDGFVILRQTWPVASSPCYSQAAAEQLYRAAIDNPACMWQDLGLPAQMPPVGWWDGGTPDGCAPYSEQAM